MVVVIGDIIILSHYIKDICQLGVSIVVVQTDVYTVERGYISCVFAE